RSLTASGRSCCWCPQGSTHTGAIRWPSSNSTAPISPGSPPNCAPLRCATPPGASFPRWRAATTCAHCRKAASRTPGRWWACRKNRPAAAETSLARRPRSVPLRLRNEVQRGRVDAVAQPGRRRTVGEHMPQVRITARAAGLDAAHAMAEVFVLGHGFDVHGRVEARPAAARVVLGVRFKQRAATGHAAVLARLLVVPVFAGERRLGGRAAADRVLLVGQLFPPFSIGSIAGWFCHGLFHGPNAARHGIALLLHQGYGMLAAAFGPTGKHRVRPALRLLPLPLCIAVSLTAFADDERPGMWRLCPLEDAVPVFPDAPPPVGTPAERDQHPTDIEGDELS